MKNLHNINDLLIDELQELHNAERHLEKHLPQAILKAASPELKTILTSYYDQTGERIERLEQAFRSFSQPVINGKCEVMEALIEKGNRLRKKSGESHVSDAANVLAVQCINHYMIALYGSLAAYARATGYAPSADLLQYSLNEERSIDQRLSDLAIKSINSEAKEKLLMRA